MKNLDQRLQQIIVVTFYVLFLCTPLIWFRHNSELFEYPKMVFVYLLSFAIFAAWGVRCVLAAKVIIRRSIFDAPIMLFVISQIISTILSIHPHTSVFGYYTRFHGGLLSTLCYVGLYYAFVSNLSKAQALRAVSTIVTSLTIASVYAAPEHFNFSLSCMVVSGSTEANCWIQDVKTRIFGTFGQPNWLAAYVITTIPLSWSLALIRKKQSQLQLASLWLIQLLGLATLVYTKSRSGLIGYGLGSLVFWGFYFWLNLGKTKQKSAKLQPHQLFAWASVISIAIFIAFNGTELSPSVSQFVSREFTQTAPSNSGTVLDNGDLSIPVINQSGTESGKIREIVWRGAVEIIKHYPIVGTGVETFGYAYYNYRPMEHNLVSEWDFLYNKAHNEFLNMGANSGLFGLGSYLLLIGIYSGASLWFITDKDNKSTDEKIIALGLLSGFLALNVSNFFGFSTVAVGVLFFIFPAIYLTMSDSEKVRNIKIETLNKPVFQALALSAIIMFWAYGSLRTAQAYYADTLYAKATSHESSLQYAQAEQWYLKAIALSPQEARFHNDFANLLSKMALEAAYQKNMLLLTDYARRAFLESAATLTANPVHLNFYKSQAGVFIRLSPTNPELLETAETILLDASSLAPTDPKIIYNLGLIAKDSERPQEAISYLEQVVAMKANYEEARYELALLYISDQQPNKAREQLQYILSYIAPQNLQVIELLKELDGDTGNEI